MAIKAHLTPKRGLVVRDPLTGLQLPAEGAEVSMTPYWLRRMADGDVHEKAAAKPAKPNTAHRSQE